MKSGSAQRLRIGLEGLHLGLQLGQILALLLYDVGWGEGDEARVGQLGPLAFQPRLFLGRVDLTGDKDLYPAHNLNNGQGQLLGVGRRLFFPVPPVSDLPGML